MTKAKELKTTKGIVKVILTEKPQTRNSDSFLYLEVLNKVCKEKEIDINKLTVPYLLLLGKDLGLPGFETVRRTRQKLQAEFPEFSATDEIQAYREKNEVVYREFARSGA